MLACQTKLGLSIPMVRDYACQNLELPPNSGTYQLLDVHGAGAQRSDPKIGNPADYPHGLGPQGDVRRIYNFVRCVRGAS